jgi:2-methylcitrate dehydratase PrpD
MADLPAARRLADWAAALRWPEIPAEQRALVPLRVLDTVGLILAGAETPAATAVVAVARAQGTAAESTVLGVDAKLPAAAAALAHGTIAHCRDFDDTFQDSVVHAGSVVVSAALALGEARRAAAADIGAALVAGYEAAARVGGVAGRRFHQRGIHATGVVGPIAAAVAASRILALDGERTASAIGLAASMSGGLMAFMADGAWSKWLHCGWAAQGGIVAAALAERGFRGPLSALDGRHNLFAALLAGETLELAPMTSGLGVEWRGGAAQFKSYPCAHVIQPYIDGALAIAAGESLMPSDIAMVRCDIAPWAAAIVCEPRAAKLRPASELEAIASLPYQLAAALTLGRVGLEALEAPMRSRDDLASLAMRIVHREDAALGHGFDGRLMIETRSGRRFERAVTSMPPDATALRAKFVANAARRIGEARAAALADAILSAEAPAHDLMARIAAGLIRPAS